CRVVEPGCDITYGVPLVLSDAKESFRSVDRLDPEFLPSYRHFESTIHDLFITGVERGFSVRIEIKQCRIMISALGGFLPGEVQFVYYSHAAAEQQQADGQAPKPPEEVSAFPVILVPFTRSAPNDDDHHQNQS